MASRSLSKNTSSEASLLEQVRLLQIENDALRSFIADKGFAEKLNVPPGNSDSKATEKRSRRGSTSAVRSKKSPNVPTTPRTPFTASGKGCSCKGNCSTKVCGCVKKNIPCAEFCRCGDELCQNSEPNKENIGDANQAQLSKDGEESLIKLSNLTLGDKKGLKKKLADLLPENKRLENDVKPRSIFSPDVAENPFTFEDAVGESQEAQAKKSKKNDKKTENPKAKNTRAAAKQTEPPHPALSDNPIYDNSKPKPSNQSKKNVEKREKATAKQSDLVDLKPMDESTQDDKHSEPEPTTNRKKKAEIRKKTNVPTGKQKNKIDSEVEDSQQNEHSDPEPTNKTKKNVDTKTTGAMKKENEKGRNFEAMDEEDFEENEPSLPKISKPTNKNKNKAENKGKAGGAATAASKKRNDETASQDSANSELESEYPNTKRKVSNKKANTRGARKQNNLVSSQDEEKEEEEEEEEEEETASRENEHSDSDSEPKQRRNHRIHSDDIDEASQDSENSKYEPEIPNKNKKAMGTRGGDKQNNRADSEADNETSSQSNESSDSEDEPTHRNKKKAEEKGSTMPGKSRRINRIYSEEEENDASEGMKLQSKNDHAENVGKKESLESPTETNTSSSLLYETPVDPESDGFNPMKPRRQLSRSPLVPQLVPRPGRIDVSNVPLPIPVKEEPEEEVPPPAELAKDILENWDEHQAMLVKCSKCSRTFHPHRIKIHEMSCIKI